MNKLEVLEKVGIFSGLGESVSKERFSIDSTSESLLYADRPIAYNAVPMAAKWANIPINFFSRVPIDLQETLLNRLLEKENNYPKFIYNDEKIVAFAHPSAEILNVETIVNTLDTSLTEAEVDKLFVRDGSIEMYAHGPREHSVTVGDVVMGGIWVKFSPIAEVNPEIAGYMFRLVCSNGMIRKEEFARFSFARGYDPYEWIGENAYNLYNQMEEQVLKYRDMQNVKLNGNLSATLNHLTDGLPRDIQSALKDHVMDNKPANMYDLMNTIAYFATHKLEDPRHIWNTMAVSGNTVEHNHELCPMCHGAGEITEH